MVTAIIANRNTGQRLRLRFLNWELCRNTLMAMAGGKGSKAANLLKYKNPWE